MVHTIIYDKELRDLYGSDIVLCCQQIPSGKDLIVILDMYIFLDCTLKRQTVSISNTVIYIVILKQAF